MLAILLLFLLCRLKLMLVQKVRMTFMNVVCMRRESVGNMPSKSCLEVLSDLSTEVKSVKSSLCVFKA